MIWNAQTQTWDSLIGTAVATATLTNISTNIMRVDAIYFTPGGTDTSTSRLPCRDKLDIDAMARDWRTSTDLYPVLWYQDDTLTVSFWPFSPLGTGTYIFEYPVLTTFTSTSDPMVIPAWTRYDCVAYVAYRALSRFGPNQDLPKAFRYRRKHERNLKRYRKYFDAYFPEKAEMLRPGRKYAGNILVPRQHRQIRP